MASAVGARETLTNLKYFPITIFFSLLLLEFAASSRLNSFMTICPATNTTHNNQTAELPRYKINLKKLLVKLGISASTSNFNKSVAGSSPHEVYGLYVCHGDATSELCFSCVTDLANSISTDIESACIEGIAYGANCMLHYANYSSLGQLNDESLRFALKSGNVTNVAEFNRTRMAMGEELIHAAAESPGLFATREASVGAEDGKLYGWAQCTPDIGRVNCSRCLKNAFSEFGTDSANYTAAWFMLQNCQLRYDNSSSHEVVGTPVNLNPPGAVVGAPATSTAPDDSGTVVGTPANSANAPDVAGAVVLATWTLVLLKVLLS